MARDNNEGMFKGFLIGFLVGSALGAVLAMLFTPKSGKEMRALIKEKSAQAKEKAEGYLGEAKAKAEEVIEKAKEEA
ncbi:YtxH-like protein [Candidatus Kryptobacter tengchongensis]|nr:YtxH-like protein [Candidatus Kryptobacter tengchongensis]